MSKQKQSTCGHQGTQRWWQINLSFRISLSLSAIVTEYFKSMQLKSVKNPFYQRSDDTVNESNQSQVRVDETNIVCNENVDFLFDSRVHGKQVKYVHSTCSSVAQAVVKTVNEMGYVTGSHTWYSNHILPSVVNCCLMDDSKSTGRIDSLSECAG